MKWLFGCSLSLALALAAPAQARPTIYKGLLAGGNEGELSTFVELMNEVFRAEDLRRMFDGDHDFTIFAPTDAAFAELFDALSEDELASFQDLNTGRMERLLRYHVTQGEWRHPTGGLRMLDDSIAHTHAAGRTFRIDDAVVVDRTHYRNGLVLTIAKVISPPETPLPGSVSDIATVHANHLFLDTDGEVTGEFGQFVITEGEPWDGTSFLNNTLLIDAGRKKSEPPADFLKSGLTAVNMGNTNNDSGEPRELNFTQQMSTLAIAFDDVSFTCHDVRLGQGVGASGVNWWIAQPNAFVNEQVFFLDCTASKPPCRLQVDWNDLHLRTFAPKACCEEDIDNCID